MKRNPDENPIGTVLDGLYMNGDNRQDVNFWAPLAHLTTECLELRDAARISQAELAGRMNTTQSVISRFENMGGNRLPSYGFIARLSQAFEHEAGMTLYGDFMAVAPLNKHPVVARVAKERNIPTAALVGRLLEEAINTLEVSAQYTRNIREFVGNGNYAISADSTPVPSPKAQNDASNSSQTATGEQLPNTMPGAA